ncbi:energy transducer TonB [Mucilaginibacter terrenus]|nr:energy transducer TonB [Mucilaginibacter terrenus]
MKSVTSIILLFISPIVFAQTKRVTRETPQGTVKYFVLKSDKKIKTGSYEIYAENGPSVTVRGFYKDDLKDSLWQFFAQQKLVAEEHYKNGNKCDIWTGYNRGFERLKYDPVKNDLSLYIPAKMDSMFNITPLGMPPGAVLERHPIYLGGNYTIAYLLASNIRYPATARTQNKQGELTLTLSIDEEGNMANCFIKDKLGYGLDNEVLRVAQMLPGSWVPAMAGGKKVAAQIDIPIAFELNATEPRAHKPGQIVISAFSVMR